MESNISEFFFDLRKLRRRRHPYLSALVTRCPKCRARLLSRAAAAATPSSPALPPPHKELGEPRSLPECRKASPDALVRLRHHGSHICRSDWKLKPKPSFFDEVGDTEISLKGYMIVSVPHLVHLANPGNKYMLVPENMDPHKWRGTYRRRMNGSRSHNTIVGEYNHAVVGHLVNRYSLRENIRKVFAPVVDHYIGKIDEDEILTSATRRRRRCWTRDGGEKKGESIAENAGEYERYWKYLFARAVGK